MRQFKSVLIGMLSLPLMGATRPVFAEVSSARTESCGRDLGLQSQTEDPSERPRRVAAELKVEAESLLELKRVLPVALSDPEIKQKPWYALLSRLLISAKTNPSDLVTIALVGGAATGKSTLMNAIPSLANADQTYRSADLISAPGWLGGTTLRPLIAMAKGFGEAYERRRKDLESRFGILNPIESPRDMLKDGPALLSELRSLSKFENLAFIDTPDITTGDPRVHFEARNLQTTRDAILAADVVFIMLHDHNVRDLNLHRLLAENFRFYGARRAVFILRTQGQTAERVALSKDALLQAARIFYDQAADDLSVPEGILGMYAMPVTQDVLDEKAHPTLVPWNGSVSFPELLTKISRDSVAIRNYSVRKAAEIIFRDIALQMKIASRRRYAARIYQIALRDLSELPPKPAELAYDDAANDWRDFFSQQRSGVSKAIERAARYVAYPGLRARQKVLGRAADGYDQTVETSIRTSEDLIRKSWEAHVSGMLRNLGQGRVTLTSESAAELLEIIRKFNMFFPEDKVSDNLLTKTESTATLQLPSPNLLGATAREAVQNLVGIEAELLSSRLFRSAPSEPAGFFTKEKVAEGMKEIHDNLYKRHSKIRDSFGNSLTLSGLGAGPGSYVVGKFVFGKVLAASSPPLFAISSVSAIVGLGLSSYNRWGVEKEIDKDLEPSITQWFAAYQSKVFARALGGRVFAPVQKILDREAPDEQSRALSTVQKVLGRLGVPVPEYFSDI